MNQQYGGMNNGMMNMMQATQNPMMQQAANDPVPGDFTIITTI